jgi:hypothetical protein
MSATSQAAAPHRRPRPAAATARGEYWLLTLAVQLLLGRSYRDDSGQSEEGPPVGHGARGEMLAEEPVPAAQAGHEGLTSLESAIYSVSVNVSTPLTLPAVA